MATACRNLQLLLFSAPYRPYADVEECREPVARRVLIENEPVDLCLWHSLVAAEHLGARFVRTLTPT